METPSSQPNSHPSRFWRIRRLSALILKDTLHQLSQADLNPHEGRLRSSVAPAEYLPQIPDFPPSHDDTL